MWRRTAVDLEGQSGYGVSGDGRMKFVTIKLSHRCHLTSAHKIWLRWLYDDPVQVREPAEWGVQERLSSRLMEQSRLLATGIIHPDGLCTRRKAAIGSVSHQFYPKWQLLLSHVFNARLSMRS